MYNKIKGLFVGLTLLVTLTPAFAQGQGGIRGTVYDQTTGETIIAASVRMEGTEQVVFTDINGTFVFRNVNEGTYALIANFDGFAQTTVTDVVVKKGESTSVIIQMPLDVFQAELVVTAELGQESEAGLLQHRQKSISISDAIGAEEISRSGGSSAADAVTKITGASVVGGKYVYIRGLGDRYTSTHLNGVEMPTSDPDVKAFQADMFPSNILDNIVTLKSFTPDKPGNFSGGIIDIGTKEFPSEFSLNLSYSAGFRSGTTGNSDYINYLGGGRDWLGYDDGTRGLPSLFEGGTVDVPSPIQARTNEELAQQLDDATKAFTPVMGSSNETAPIDQSFGVSLGGMTLVGDRDFGYLASLTYSRKYTYYDEWERNRWKLNEEVAAANAMANQSDMTQNQGKDKVVWGGLFSTTYLLADTHEIAFNAVYNQSGESTADNYSGQWSEQFINPDTVLESRVLKYSERNLQSYQLRGDHVFLGLKALEMKWVAATATTSQDEPDTRIFTNHYTDRIINGEETRIYSITQANYPAPARYFRELEEDSDTFKLDFELPFEQWAGRSSKLKFGYAYDKKERDFNELRYEYQVGSEVRYNGDPASFFAPENSGIIGYDDRTNRYIFGNVIQFAQDARGGDYDGTAEVSAFYGMVEMPLTEKLKLITGFRNERSDYFVSNSRGDFGELDNNDWLPSMHYMYAYSDKTNYRLSYGRTLARPNLRELAPYSSFDFIADGFFVGNPDLERTLIDNFDFRWEHFPRVGELFAISAFYKDFENPIERSFNSQADFGEKQFVNVPSATVYGLELEARKKLASQEALSFFSVTANISLIKSEVDIPENNLLDIRRFDPDASSTRELQGQSPYLVNLGLLYDNFNTDTSVSVYYNVFGERIHEVGIGPTRDAIEKPRHMVDLTFSQSIWEKFRLKLSAKNLLDEPIEIVQEFKGNDFVQSRYKAGTTLSLSFSYKP